MKEFLILKYYNKLLSYSREHHGYYELIKEKEKDILDSLNKIIEANNQHILTDSYLMHIVSYSNFMVELRLHYEDNLAKQIRYISYYYNNILDDYYKNKPYSEHNHFYTKSLDEITRKATLIANNHCNYIEEVYNDEKQDFYTIYKVTLIVLAYCHIYNKMNDFENIYSFVLVIIIK